MTTERALSDLTVQAEILARRASTNEERKHAINMFRVAADMAEERGALGWARDLRADARKLVVLGWAWQRFPLEKITRKAITMLVPPLAPGPYKPVELTHALVLRPNAWGWAGTSELTVRVDRRDRVTIREGWAGSRSTTGYRGR